MKHKISVIGLGKLGACTAACFAASGFEVIGVDINPIVVESINRGIPPVLESELETTLQKAKNKLRATNSFKTAVEQTDISFLIVPTPSHNDGTFSTDYLQEALLQLSLSLRENSKPYHIFVIVSTVSPKSIENELIPFIEFHSGRKFNHGFGVAYNPEFIALGSVIKDFLNPDLVIIGESSKKVGDILEQIYNQVCMTRPLIARMSIVNAEIAKLSLNAYITMKISFVNTLSNICENVHGADIDTITNALGADKRISPFYLKGGTSFGGPCFPRDNKAFLAFAADHGIKAKISQAVDEINDDQNKHLLNLVLSKMQDETNVIAVLGLSYKPNTNVIDEAPAIKLIDQLLKKGNYTIIVYDPLAIQNTKQKFGNKINYAASIAECVTQSSICVVTTNDQVYKEIVNINTNKKLSTIIDCWRMLDPSLLKKHIQYISLGKAIHFQEKQPQDLVTV
jgi:UDPglucose 6-dehydrogenase